MTTINVVRYADGRTVYNCKNPSYPPTNPKLGVDGNTVYWNGRTRETTVTVPRQQDEYFSRNSTQTSPRTFLPALKAQETSPPYISTPTQSGDYYGRTAPLSLERSRLQTDTSRYSTDTNLIFCLPVPTGGTIKTSLY